jgi:hypothetical protein
MKKELTTFFSNLFGKKPAPPEPQKLFPVVLTSYSQPHVLQQRMKEAKLTHGQTIKGDIFPVRLEVNFGKMVMYFCPAQDIIINERVTDGDGGAIPGEAILKGFENVVPGNTTPGLYTLKNVNLFSNGTMQVIAGDDTVFEPFGNPHVGYAYSGERRPTYTPSREVLESLNSREY